jgi:hypothetical protein
MASFELRLDPSALPSTRPIKQVTGSPPKRIHVAAASTLILGRSQSCDVVIDNITISRRHLQLRATQHGLKLINCGSNPMLADGICLCQGEVCIAWHPRHSPPILISIRFVRLPFLTTRRWLYWEACPPKLPAAPFVPTIAAT